MQNDLDSRGDHLQALAELGVGNIILNGVVISLCLRKFRSECAGLDGAIRSIWKTRTHLA